jgi:PmbA protein
MKMEIAELAVKKALNFGATEAEAYVQKTKTLWIEYAEKIETFKIIESIGLGLRVAINKKVAMHSASILDEKEGEKAAEKAVKIAKIAPEDPNWKNLNKKFGQSPAKGYYDEKLEKLDYDEIVEKLTAAIEKMSAYDRRVKPARGLLAASTVNTVVLNSYGEENERKETYLSAWMRAKAEEGEKKSTGTEDCETRFYEEMKLEEMAVKAAKKAVKFLNAKPIESREVPVIIRNKIFANILGVILSGPLNADWVQKGRSPLSNKIGTQIASQDINLVDDGTMVGGWRTRPFDDEGHPTQKTALIEKGVLKNYLYDTYTALKDHVESTGNAYKPRYWIPPQPSPSNLILNPETTSPEEMIQETKNGVFIEETIGEWLSNPVSGNLNATITHGYLVENGELTKPIKGVVISGNFYELLKNGIELVGNDLRNSMQNYSPTVKLSKVTIAGK